MSDTDKEAIDRTEFNGRTDGGDSAGGAYPRNPPAEEDEEQGGFMGHGGQSDMPYHGHGQLGEKKVGHNPNSPAEEGK